MKFGDLIEYNKGNIFLQKSCRKWDRETGCRLLFLFWESFILGKSKWSAAWFNYVLIALKLAYNKSKLFKTLHYWSRDMLKFEFLDKCLGTVSFTHFAYDISIKIFLILYFISWPNVIIPLPLFVEILGNICIAIVC